MQRHGGFLKDAGQRSGGFPKDGERRRGVFLNARVFRRCAMSYGTAGGLGGFFLFLLIEGLNRLNELDDSARDGIYVALHHVGATGFDDVHDLSPGFGGQTKIVGDR